MECTMEEGVKKDFQKEEIPGISLQGQGGISQMKKNGKAIPSKVDPGAEVYREIRKPRAFGHFPPAPCD